MYDKVTIFNLALNALLLTTQIIDADTDTIPQAKVLRQFYPIALGKTLADLDLNTTSTQVQLEEITVDLNTPHWQHTYKYPTNCVKLRRIISCYTQDNQETRIPSETATIAGVKVILTNKPEAWADIQSSSTPLSSLNYPAGLAIAHQLAFLSSSLIVGKGARDLKKSIMESYVMFKAEAMQADLEENIDTTPDEFQSEFVSARLGGSKWPSRT